jgi:hypothetical protein
VEARSAKEGLERQTDTVGSADEGEVMQGAGMPGLRLVHWHRGPGNGGQGGSRQHS